MESSDQSDEESTINLPKKLYLDGALSFDELVKQLFQIFFKDFIETKPYFRAKPVVFDNTRNESIYPEGFWHIITRTDYTQNGERLLDYKRAKRLPWLKSMIQQWNHPALLCWCSLEFDKSAGHEIEKYYIWYVKGKYLTVLKEKKGKYFLATAFYVTSERDEARYREKYNKGRKDFKK